MTKCLLFLRQYLRVDDLCWVGITLYEQRKKLAMCIDLRPVDRWITQPNAYTLIRRQPEINCAHLCIEVYITQCGDSWNPADIIFLDLA